MPLFLAQTSRGCVEPLAEELKSLGFEGLQLTPHGVLFESNWAGCYKANLRLRTATRVLLTIQDFNAYNEDDLYHNIQKHDFTKYIDLRQTIAVDASAQSHVFRDQRFLALKTKDAIVDQFREKFGERPNVDSKNADLVVAIRAYDTQINVSLDTSGGPLFKRGYRVKAVEAPLKEHVAAALIDVTGWDGKTPLVDPMCGSGTFLIEAALKARKIAPGSLRKRFGFQNWKNFQKDAWDAEVEQVLSEEVEMPENLLYGYDIDRKAILSALGNAKAAGVDDSITFRKGSADMIAPPEGLPPGIVIVNPPYGERLGDRDVLKDAYRDLGFALKKNFKGWTAWVLSGDPELSGLLGMKATRRFPVWNGGIECRFLKYEIRS